MQSDCEPSYMKTYKFLNLKKHPVFSLFKIFFSRFTVFSRFPQAIDGQLFDQSLFSGYPAAHVILEKWYVFKN